MARRERVNGHFQARVNLITCYMLFKITFLMRQTLAETQCDTVSDDVRGRSWFHSKCFLVCLRVLCDSASDVCSKSLERTSHVNILTQSIGLISLNIGTRTVDLDWGCKFLDFFQPVLIWGWAVYPKVYLGLTFYQELLALCLQGVNIIQ